MEKHFLDETLIATISDFTITQDGMYNYSISDDVTYQPLFYGNVFLESGQTSVDIDITDIARNEKWVSDRLNYNDTVAISGVKTICTYIPILSVNGDDYYGHVYNVVHGYRYPNRKKIMEGTDFFPPFETTEFEGHSQIMLQQEIDNLPLMPKYPLIETSNYPFVGLWEIPEDGTFNFNIQLTEGASGSTQVVMPYDITRTKGVLYKQSLNGLLSSSIREIEIPTNITNRVGFDSFVLLKESERVNPETGSVYPLTFKEGLVNIDNETFEFEGETYYKWTKYEERSDGSSVPDEVSQGMWEPTSECYVLTTTLKPSLPFTITGSTEYVATIAYDEETSYDFAYGTYPKIASVNADNDIINYSGYGLWLSTPNSEMLMRKVSGFDNTDFTYTDEINYANALFLKNFGFAVGLYTDSTNTPNKYVLYKPDFSGYTIDELIGLNYTISFTMKKVATDEIGMYNYELTDINFVVSYPNDKDITLKAGTDNTILPCAVFEHCYSRYYLLWQDRYGSFQSQPFNNKVKFSNDYERTEVQDYRNNRRYINVLVQPKWEINTDWMPEELYPFYESIYVSPILLLYDTEEDASYNVMVTGNYTEKTFRSQKSLINLTLQLEENKKQNIVY